MVDTWGAERGLKRFEGFTDAVFAIALTLLIVEIKPPGSPAGPAVGASLWHAIAEQWREHLALLLSFFAIGVYWLQHHYTGRIYARSDHGFSAINLGFLLAVMAVPYPIRMWSFHVGTVHEPAASVALTVGLMMPALFWMAKWLYARPRPIMDERLAPDFVRQMTRRYAISTGLHVAAVPLAWVAPRLGVGLALLILLYFLLPQPKPRYRPGMEPDEKEVTAE
jgi:uncharacterized membrane protein